MHTRLMNEHDEAKKHDMSYLELKVLTPHIFLTPTGALSAAETLDIEQKTLNIQRWINFRFFSSAANKLLEEFVMKHKGSLQNPQGFYTYLTAVIWAAAPFLSEGLSVAECDELRKRWVLLASAEPLQLTSAVAEQKWNLARLRLKNTRMSLAKDLNLKTTGNLNLVMQPASAAAGSDFEPVPDRFVSPAEILMLLSVLQHEYHSLITGLKLKPWTISVTADGQSVVLTDATVDFKRMSDQTWAEAPAIGDFYNELLKPASKDALQKGRLAHARSVATSRKATVKAWHATELLKLNCFFASMVHGALEYRKALRNSLTADEKTRVKLIRDKLNHHQVLFSERAGTQFIYRLAKDAAGNTRSPDFATAEALLSFFDIENAFFTLPEWESLLQKLLTNW